ncbi:hypothetical protein LCGC14_1229050, partial [marine sediment metagenome]
MNSTVIFEADNPITAVWLFVNETVPPETSIKYFISGDGLVYTAATPGFRTVLASPGTSLNLIVNLTTANVNVTPIVHSMNVKVIPAALANVTVLLGGNEIFRINDTFDYPYNYSDTV